MNLAAFQGANGQFDPAKKDEVMADRLTPNGTLPPAGLTDDHLGEAIDSFGHLFTGRPA